MGSSRRNLLIGLGGIVAASGAVVGSGALSAFTAQREANIPITNDSDALVSIELGPAANNNSNSVITETNGNIGIDFTNPSNSDGVQTDATYQLGGIGVNKPPVNNSLSNDSVAYPSGSGFPSPLDTGTNANNNAALVVRNNSTGLLGVSPAFEPGNNFPTDGRVLIVSHDRANSVDSDGDWDDELRAKMYGPSGQIGSATFGGTAWRPAQVGESVGISLWIYTGTDQSADLSGELQISAVDNNGGVIGEQ